MIDPQQILVFDDGASIRIEDRAAHLVLFSVIYKPRDFTGPTQVKMPDRDAAWEMAVTILKSIFQP